jgi:hypothetical protein
MSVPVSLIGHVSFDISEGIGGSRITTQRRCQSRDTDHLPQKGARLAEPVPPIADKSPTVSVY